MKGLDDYIMGTHKYSEETVPHECPKCGITKDIPMFFDMGGWFYKDDDNPYCEQCQCDMEIIGESQ